MILNEMGLDEADVKKRKAKQLSGGMLRRLALCNAVVSAPHLLLLDEISAGVDPVVKRKIWKCIEQIKHSRNISVVLSTHDTSEIAEMAQRISVLDKGFAVLNNASPFDLRSCSNTYSVKFYNEKPSCCFETAEKICDALKAQTGIEAISIDTISPHSIQIIIRAKLNKDQLIALASQLSELT